MEHKLLEVESLLEAISEIVSEDVHSRLLKLRTAHSKAAWRNIYDLGDEAWKKITDSVAVKIIKELEDRKLVSMTEECREVLKGVEASVCS